MRQHLNNPRIVLPLALFAAVWAAYSYGLLDGLLSRLPKAKPVPIAETEVQKEEWVMTESGRRMQGLNRALWLPGNWQRMQIHKREPFVASYDFGKNALPEIPELEIAETAVEAAVVIIDFEKLESYIAEQLGLDQDGYFVRFQNVLDLPVRKRPGDLLHSADGRVLELGQIAMAETLRDAAAHATAVQQKLHKLRLSGSILSESPSTSDADAPEPNRQRAQSAVISGGIKASGIYAQGELVTKDPALGLDAVHDDSVRLVDSQGSSYRLELVD